jgi:hypothetical protein
MRLLMAVMTAPLPALPGPPISEACTAADAVVVGNVHRGPGAAIVDVTVLQVIKGAGVEDKILPAQLPGVPSGRFDSEDNFTAIVFLKQDGADWRVNSLAGDNAPLSELMLPGKNAPLAGGQIFGGCEDQVFARTVAALDDGNVAWYRMPVLGWFYGFDSARYREQLGALSHEANLEFRAMGLGGRFALGDVGALQQLVGDAASFGASTLAELGMILRTYRNPDPTGIAELGRIAAPSDAKYAPLVHGAAFCLHALHTFDSLPILYRLLDSSDPIVRLEAMFGFAAFVANFPIHRPEDGPSNRNLTSLPGGKYTTGDGQSHFPRIGSDNQDTLAFWKAWYRANFGKSQ